MNRFKDFLGGMSGKTVALIGIGVSNRPLVKLLCDAGAIVSVRDRKQAHLFGDFYDDLCNWGVRCHLGHDYLVGLDEAYIFKSPGIRYDLPEITAARNNGSILTSELECFFEVCDAPIIGVTGSDGKTTTSSILHRMLQAAGHNAWLGGNIGRSMLCEARNIKAQDVVVLEMSSFQLHTMKRSPRIAVITNIWPNHLDVHTSMEEYVDAKSNICRYQTSDDRLVIHADNPNCKHIRSNGDTWTFSSTHAVERGAYVQDGQIYVTDGAQTRHIMGIDDVMLPGMHNVENYLAAIAAVQGYVSDAQIVDTARTFPGVEHRMEFVREVDGVKYYNDSKSTSPTHTKAALHTFDRPIILIAGGSDKKIPFDELGQEIADHAKRCILIGETAPKIYDAIQAAVGNDVASRIAHRCDDLHAAVAYAAHIAERGDIVILSPACASFDMFANFEERGNAFKHSVMEL